MPWGRLDDSLYDHPKLDLLGDDRLAAVGLWSVSISWCNRFLTDGHVPAGQVTKLGGTHELAGRLVEAGLFDEARGGYLVHDFLAFNDSKADVLERRRKEADRKAEWRRSRGVSQRDKDAVPAGHESDSRSVSQRDTADVPAGHGVKMSRRDSRARDVARIPTRPDPTRPDRDSLERDSAGAGEREDIAALLERDWPKVTKAQRRVLDEVLGRHDVTGPAFAAEVIRATPIDADPLAAVMEADRQWQVIQRNRVDAEETAWAETKADERNGAGDALSHVGDLLGAWKS